MLFAADCNLLQEQKTENCILLQDIALFVAGNCNAGNKKLQCSLFKLHCCFFSPRGLVDIATTQAKCFYASWLPLPADLGLDAPRLGDPRF